MRILLLPLLLALIGCAFAEEYQRNKVTTCTGNLCLTCVDGQCHPGAAKREIDTSTSTNCNNDGCQICVNGNCHYEPRGKRDAGHPTHNTTHKWHQPHCTHRGCYVCDDTPRDKCHNERFKPSFYSKREAESLTYNTTDKWHGPYCLFGGCHVCDDAPRDKCHNPHFEPFKPKQEAEQVHSSTTNCDNNGCHICVNGDCHYRPNGKREIDTSTSTNCNNDGCQICVNGNCHYEPRGKREAVYPTYNTTDQWHGPYCTLGGCHVCDDTPKDKCHNPHFEPFKPKREAEQVHSSTTNCNNKGCLICVNGDCHYRPNGKREVQSHSKSCTNGRCIECTNGTCRTYQE